MNVINELKIYCPGDPSVGIPSATYTLSGPVIIDPGCVGRDEEEQLNYVEEQRTYLRKMFFGFFDERVMIQFDFEYNVEEREV